MYTTEFRALDVRLGRWFTPDPITQPWSSPYASMDNNPIALTDVLGLQADPVACPSFSSTTVSTSITGNTTGVDFTSNPFGGKNIANLVQQIIPSTVGNRKFNESNYQSLNRKEKRAVRKYARAVNKKIGTNEKILKDTFEKVNEDTKNKSWFDVEYFDNNQEGALYRYADELFQFVYSEGDNEESEEKLEEITDYNQDADLVNSDGKEHQHSVTINLKKGEAGNGIILKVFYREAKSMQVKIIDEDDNGSSTTEYKLKQGENEMEITTSRKVKIVIKSINSDLIKKDEQSHGHSWKIFKKIRKKSSFSLPGGHRQKKRDENQ